MKHLFELLEKHTGQLGFWSLRMNEHKSVYAKTEYEIKAYYGEDGQEWKASLEKPLFVLDWYNETPAGKYQIIANSIDDIYKEVLEIVKELEENDR